MGFHVSPPQQSNFLPAQHSTALQCMAEISDSTA